MHNKQIVENVMIPVFGTHAVAADIYWGHSGRPGKPCIIWLHGGGFVGGDKRQFSGMAAYLSLLLDAVCISINYRTAVVERYPAPIIDSLGVCNWVHANRQQLSIGQIYLAGGSPGGNIAAMSMVNGKNILADAGISVQTFVPAHGILLNPILDLNGFYRNNPDERSRVDAYLGSDSKEMRKASSPIFYPSKAKSFLILQGTEDNIVGFEGVERMEFGFAAFGSAVKVKTYGGEPHGWFNEAEKMANVAHDIEEYVSSEEGKCSYGIEETGAAL